MARARHFVVLALVMFAIIDLTSAADKAAAPSDDHEVAGDENSIGTTGTSAGGALSPNSVVAAPIGGPVPPGAFDSKASAPSAASSFLYKFSAVAVATTTVVAAGLFYL